MISSDKLTELQNTEWNYEQLKSKIRELREEAYGSPGEEHVTKELLSFIEALEKPCKCLLLRNKK